MKCTVRSHTPKCFRETAHYQIGQLIKLISRIQGNIMKSNKIFRRKELAAAISFLLAAPTDGPGARNRLHENVEAEDQQVSWTGSNQYRTNPKRN